MMDEAVYSRDSHGLVREYLIPCAERLIGGDCDTFVFVSASNQLEQDAGFSLILMRIRFTEIHQFTLRVFIPYGGECNPITILETLLDQKAMAQAA